MPKVYRANHAGESLCKDLQLKMNLHSGPTRLVQPNFYLIVDVDHLQKQINRMENMENRRKRTDDGRRWRRSAKR